MYAILRNVAHNRVPRQSGTAGPTSPQKMAERRSQRWTLGMCSWLCVWRSAWRTILTVHKIQLTRFYMENLGTTSAAGFAALAAHVGCRTSQWRRAVASGTASWFAMEPIWNRYGTVCMLCYMDLGSVAWEYYGILLQWCASHCLMAVRVKAWYLQLLASTVLAKEDHKRLECVL